MVTSSEVSEVLAMQASIRDRDEDLRARRVTHCRSVVRLLDGPQAGDLRNAWTLLNIVKVGQALEAEERELLRARIDALDGFAAINTRAALELATMLNGAHDAPDDDEFDLFDLGIPRHFDLNDND